MSSSSSSPSVHSPLFPPLYLPEHIIVLVHGNNGAPEDFDSVCETLRLKYTNEELLIIVSRANHTQTSLGVDVGGEKLAIEIVNEILKYDLSPTVTTYKFSIMGHSLGGLYGRYAMPQVQEELSMLNMDYVSFVTLCTPHLGSRRPRAPSTIKNVYRMGVHKVLASKKFYGQTGVDLLVENDTTNTDMDPNMRPVLEVMSELDSVFISALRRFRHCTLMAMADGDVVVPFASASIRNFNPYPSLFLTKKFDAWRWHIRHYGFDTSPAPLLERLNEHVDELLEIDPDHVYAGLDVTTSVRFPSVEGEYDSDNKHEVEFTFDLIRRQQAAVPWRRVDILVEPSGVKGKLRLHDWSINKMQLPDCGALGFIDLVTDMLGSDHGLALRRLPMPLSDAVVHSDAIDGGVDEGEDRSSRVSISKWSVDTNQFGEQMGTLFQTVRSRFQPSPVDGASPLPSAETGNVGPNDTASQSFFQQIRSRLTSSPAETITTETYVSTAGARQNSTTTDQHGTVVTTVGPQHYDMQAVDGQIPTNATLSSAPLNGVETVYPADTASATTTTL